MHGDEKKLREVLRVSVPSVVPSRVASFAAASLLGGEKT